MPFPFLPVGAIVALSVMVGALTVFGLVLRATDRAATRAVAGLRGSVLPGLVSGLRGWTGESRSASSGPAASLAADRLATPAARDGHADIEIIDLDA